MPDVAQTPPKADGVEGKRPNAEAELKAQQEAAQAEALKKQQEEEAKEAKAAQQGVEEAKKGLEDSQLKKREELLKASGTAVPSDKLETSGSASIEQSNIETPTVGEQDQTQPDVDLNKMSETPTPKQMPIQETTTQPVEAKVAEKESQKEYKKPWWDFLGVTKPEEKPNKEVEKHVEKADRGDPDSTQKLEEIATTPPDQKKPEAGGQNPEGENKQ